MRKKSTATGIALCALFALAALPAAASANIELKSGATTAPVGTEVRGTATYLVKFEVTEAFYFNCKADFAGTVAKNGSSNVQIDISNARFPGIQSEQCANGAGAASIRFETPACMRRGEFETGWTFGRGVCSGFVNGPRIITENSLLTCTYRRGATLWLSSNVGSEPLVLSMEPEQWFTPMEGSPPGCFSGLKPSGSLEFKTATGAALKLVKS
jgi:hypothetical protein